MSDFSFDDFNRIWFLTWTCYGQWLPGDQRGFVSNKFEGDQVERKANQWGTEFDKGRPRLQAKAKSLLQGAPVILSFQKAGVIKEQFEETSTFKNWQIIACSIMTNHIHLLVGAYDDPDPHVILKYYKSYASRRLNSVFTKPESGTWWTEQGSVRKIETQMSLDRCREYILHQELPLLQWKNEKIDERNV